MNRATGTKKVETPDENGLIDQPVFPNSRIESKPTGESDSNELKVEKQNVDEERIRQRAYELYEEGGFQDGNADGDWYAAEHILENENT